jgi:hypothetical protein
MLTGDQMPRRYTQRALRANNSSRSRGRPEWLHSGRVPLWVFILLSPYRIRARWRATLPVCFLSFSQHRWQRRRPFSIGNARHDGHRSRFRLWARAFCTRFSVDNGGFATAAHEDTCASASRIAMAFSAARLRAPPPTRLRAPQPRLRASPRIVDNFRRCRDPTRKLSSLTLVRKDAFHMQHCKS